jgi:hypothetical protein
VPRRGLKHVKYAIEIGGEHAAPLVLGAVDKGVPSAATDAGIGKAAIDPAEYLKRGGHRRLHRGGIADVAEPPQDDATIFCGRAIGVIANPS